MAEPMYRQIANDLRSKIESGEVAPGAQLPSENELRDHYDASRNTIRNAIRLLITRGLVVAKPGQGTFVVENITPIIIRLGVDPRTGGEWALYQQEMPSGRRLESSIPKVEIHSHAHAVIIEELLLSGRPQVVARHQELFVDSIPWSLQTSFYPIQLVEMGAPRLLVAEDLLPGAIHYLRETLGIKQAGWNEKIAVRTPDDQETTFFRLPADGRISLIEHIRTSYDQSGRPLRVTVSVYPSDRIQLVMAVGLVPAPEGWAAEVPGAVRGQIADVRAPAVIVLER
jgi:GntR family transcriptional regulator